MQNISAQSFEPSNRQAGYLNLLANVAQESPHCHKVGALLVKGGSVVNVSYNSPTWNAFAARFVKHREGLKGTNIEHASLHAEIKCILGINTEVLNRSDLYVTRVRSNGKLAMACPCNMCQAALRHVGVKRVFYTDDNEKLNLLKL